MTIENTINNSLLNDLKHLIEESRKRVYQAVNSEITTLYWNIGKRINQNILENNRADYGKQILQTLSAELQFEFGKGFSDKNLYKMLRFYAIFPDEQILSTLSGKLSWSHIVELINIDNKLEREFYAKFV